MKFWVYAIDWRSMAIEIIAERDSERKAQGTLAKYLSDRTPEELQVMTAYKTLGTTPATPEMIATVEQFKRVAGRVPSS